jgi:hypothetical protein
MIVHVTPAQHNLQVSVQLTAAGLLYCAALVSPPTSTEAIMAFGSAAWSASGNVSSMLLPNLQASTVYDVYCLAASSEGEMTPLSAVLMGAVQVTTTCCKTISIVLLQRYLRLDEPVQQFIQITTDALPSTNLELSFSFNRCCEDGDPQASMLFPSMVSVDRFGYSP